MGPVAAQNSGKRVCAHCLAQEPLGSWQLREEEGETLSFCCHGCNLAHQILKGAGLSGFYKNRAWKETGLPEGAYDRRFTDADLKPYTRKVGDFEELLLLVDGVRCASCVWVIEKLLACKPGIKEARIGFSTKSGHVRYDPKVVSPLEVLGIIADIGYSPRPYEVDESERMAKEERRSLLVRFGTALFLSMQLMASSIGLYGGYLKGMEEEARLYLGWFSFAFATPVVFYCGWPFFSGAVRAFRNRTGDMDLLVALGVGSAYAYSVWALLTGGEVYFDSAATIVAFLLLGRLVEAGARESSMKGITRLMKLLPDKALKIVDGQPVEVSAKTLVVGDLLLIRPGDRFPADGTIVEGVTEVDEAAVTGEPYPVAKSSNQKVTSGTVNLSAAVKVKVEAAGKDAFIARVAWLVAQAQAAKPALARLADRTASVFVPLVLLFSLAAFLVAKFTGAAAGEALLRAVAVLVVACPCALGLATPLAVMLAAGSAAGRGLLFRGGDVLEKLNSITLVAFDKTGTLTVGKPRVSGVFPAEGISGEEITRIAAGAEAGSSHPLGRGVLEYARAKGIEYEGFISKAVPGRGVVADTPAGVVRVGSRAFLVEAGIDCAGIGGHAREGVEAWVSLNEKCLGLMTLEDKPRGEGAAAVKALNARGLKVAMLTGDRRESAAIIADELGITDVFANLAPAAKAAWIRAARARGEKVLMVGDGINDAAALAEADVGCSMGGAADVALDTADLVLMRGDLSLLPAALRLSAKTIWIIKENLFWAFGYNAVALALAFLGVLAPLYAALLMAVSSISVVGNSLRLSLLKDV